MLFPKKLKEETLSRLANFLKIFGDETRLRMIHLLLEKERHVTEISESLRLSHSAVSHQLRALRQEYIVRTRKEGKQVFYRLADDHVKEIYEKALIHVLEDAHGEI